MGTLGQPFAGPVSKSVLNVLRTSNQSIAGGASAAIIWESSESTNDAWWDSGTNPERITVSYTGRYFLSGYLLGSSWGPGNALTMIIRTNGVTTVGYGFDDVTRNGTDVTKISDFFNFNAGDYIELYVTNTTVGNLDVSGKLDVIFFGGGFS